jgi:hypothetical protein
VSGGHEESEELAHTACLRPSGDSPSATLRAVSDSGNSFQREIVDRAVLSCGSPFLFDRVKKQACWPFGSRSIQGDNDIEEPVFISSASSMRSSSHPRSNGCGYMPPAGGTGDQIGFGTSGTENPAHSLLNRDGGRNGSGWLSALRWDSSNPSLLFPARFHSASEQPACRTARPHSTPGAPSAPRSMPEVARPRCH